uniref:TNFR-Cys domain-containing protein n=1 Tax=Knipowitschia caucasica TaxID=637954 RepID=A0AAV2JP93_KNICA
MYQASRGHASPAVKVSLAQCSLEACVITSEVELPLALDRNRKYYRQKEHYARELCNIVMACAKVTVLLRVPCLLLVICLVISQTKGQDYCQDGQYELNGRTCCMCPAGNRVQAHCTDQNHTKCEPCVDGKEYQLHATTQTTCEPCTSCEHPNANLEVARKCTPKVDSTCKCKENHYCHAGPDTNNCNICEPCRVCGSEGFRVACSASNNTVCNEKPRDDTVAIIGGTLGCLAVVAGVLGAVYWWKKRSRGVTLTDQNTEHLPLQPVTGKNIINSFF